MTKDQATLVVAYLFIIALSAVGMMVILADISTTLKATL